MQPLCHVFEVEPLRGRTRGRGRTRSPRAVLRWQLRGPRSPV